jgi:excisionase family DNA binding protein
MSKHHDSAERRCLLSIPEVAWLLGVDNSTVCRAIRLGIIPAMRRRGRLLVPAHVVAHLADDESRTDPPAGRGDAR